jgi:hypothetical protein
MVWLSAVAGPASVGGSPFRVGHRVAIRLLATGPGDGDLAVLHSTADRDPDFRSEESDTAGWSDDLGHPIDRVRTLANDCVAG